MDTETVCYGPFELEKGLLPMGQALFVFDIDKKKRPPLARWPSFKRGVDYCSVGGSLRLSL